MPSIPTAPDHASFKRLRLLLRDAETRRTLGLAVAEGPRLVREAVRAGAAVRLWITPSALARADGDGSGVLEQAGRGGLPVFVLDEERAKKLSDTSSPQGWMCEAATRRAVPATGTVTLAMDGLQDPGNLGTLLRSAWACGASALLGPGCADVWSPKVLRAGAGAHFHVPLREVPDLAAALRELQGAGVRCYGTDPRAPLNYLQADARGPVCWVLGSEGGGLGPQTRAVCDQNFGIRYPGGAESLNAAVSGAILLFETIRQRG